MKRCIHEFKSYEFADFDGLRDHLEQFIFAPTCFSNINHTCIELYKYFDDAVNILVPNRTRHRQNLPPWITTATSFLLKKKPETQRRLLLSEPKSYRTKKYVFLENNPAEACEDNRLVYQEKRFGTRNTNANFKHLKKVVRKHQACRYLWIAQAETVKMTFRKSNC